MCDAERVIGVEGYLTSSKGVKGRIKAEPSDFIVDEVFCRPFSGDGNTLIEIRSTNWETHALAEVLAQRFDVGKKIFFAGTKDKRAITTQLFSIPTHLEMVDVSEALAGLPGIEVQDIHHSGEELRLGDHAGNSFRIKIRDHTNDWGDLAKTVDEITSFGGFPNFFGRQRFGSVRAITHTVGKFLVNGDFEGAVYSYLGDGGKGEKEEVKEARKCVRDGRIDEALGLFPRPFSYERRMIKKLLKNGKYVTCLRSLPLYMRKLFVHAYQSYLFNELLSERLRSGTLKELCEGDYIMPFEGGRFGARPVRITRRNETAQEKVTGCEAYIMGLVPGYESTPSCEAEAKIIEAEGVRAKDFIIPDMPECSSKGTMRTLLAPLKDLKYEMEESITLTFFLYKGCYATSLLREVMKDGNP